jgi:hypothetical protein
MEPAIRRNARRPANIFEYLHCEHLAATALLNRLDDENEDIDTRDEVFFELERRLTVHAAAEEQTFYAALREADLTRFRVRTAAAQHAEIEELLAQLGSLGCDRAAWRTTLALLRRAVEQHMAEESEIFEAARQVLTPAEARALARDMEVEERRLDSGMTAPVSLPSFAGGGTNLAASPSTAS